MIQKFLLRCTNLGSFEFLVGEFKGPMTPEGLIQALNKSNIDIPAANTPIASIIILGT